MRPKHELAEIIRTYGDDFYQKYTPSHHVKRTLYALSVCRTAALGGHVERCTNEKCGHERIAYNSCRNRHCPKCQSTERERWFLDRKDEVLNCTYFHVVFTLPHELNLYCLKYPKEMYNLLFQTSKETLFTFGKDPKHLGVEQMGITAVLHTWGQNLSLHPHVHLIVPGGGFTKEGVWKKSASKGDFLFPNRALAAVYRGKFMEKLIALLKSKNEVLSAQLKNELYTKNWVVYNKKPFKNVDTAIEYLSRYTHKIAISNHRIKSIEGGKITFSYKDYADGNKTKLMSLEPTGFLRRFSMHILPFRFVKMRHYGFLSSRNKHKLRMEQMRQGLYRACRNRRLVKKDQKKRDYKEIAKERLGFDVEQCPCCKTGKMKVVLTFGANAPPVRINDKRKNTKINTPKIK